MSVNQSNTLLTREYLTQESLKYNEGVLSFDGVLNVVTGERTGRSPNDRYIVSHPDIDNDVDWGPINKKYNLSQFETLWDLSLHHLEKRSYKSILFAGANPEHQIRLCVTTEFAWHHIFAMNLFIEKDDTDACVQTWEIRNVPTMQIDHQLFKTHSESAVMIDLANKKILIIGMRYAGEMKKAVFSALNFLLPSSDILPMHCAANQGESGETALFFGLSGTGKTTLSSDPNRVFIGDDEHGWGEDGIFNIEGGCYAKCINLSEKKEPVIWQAIRPGSVMENVFLDADRQPKFDNISLSENSRMGYPIEFIDNRINSGQGVSPKHVIFLTCDLYGVLPPVSVLDDDQASFYFLMGYTAKLGSTEIGSEVNISPTFSACFGAPFFPRPSALYAKLLRKRLQESGAKVYLVNTGWQGGPYGVGKRYDIDFTRKIIHAICNNQINFSDLNILPGFGLAFPGQVSTIKSNLDPRETWSSQIEYTDQCNVLISQFADNAYKNKLPKEILKFCPVEISSQEQIETA